MASAITKWLVDPNRNPLAALHMKTLSNRLRNYGLRYDDLYDPMYDLDVKEALNRLPRDCGCEESAPQARPGPLHEARAMQTPFRSYLQEMLALVKRERAEREALGALPLYQRSIP
ncbi:hypothetical protein DH2020_006134 [Rehmannia glutinosa]|uniref:Cytochrome b-c1 complex subunit 7 n=1 Tax=Rehmannia glutinosa TaxID=99300 RepID=A0ABR0XHY9_REHGL